MPSLLLPPASADPTEHADWLELAALTAPDRDISAQDLITAFRRTGSSDAAAIRRAGSSDVDLEYSELPLDEPVEAEREYFEEVAEAALDRLATRQEYLGDQYPFSLHGALKANPDAANTAYAFLTTVTSVGWTNEEAPESAASLFEYVSAFALVGYLGGQGRARSYDFGFPRRNSPASFYDAVEDLCHKMGEGNGCGVSRSETAMEKDDKLDLVAWVPFGDNRPNQLSVFGQCATGANWQNKINELQPVDFCKKWLNKAPAVTPSVAFFVPRHIEERYWSKVAYGEHRLVFDRLRIAQLLGEMDEDLARRCVEWTESALKSLASVLPSSSETVRQP